MRRRWLWLSLAIGLGSGYFAAAAGQEADALTVVLVRHGEVVPDGTRDPDLSEEGAARAATLARMLESANVTVVYASQFQRTQQTVEPVAQQAGIEVTVVPAAAGDEHIADMAGKIRAHTAGEVVVVAGHSNTIPPMVNALTGRHLDDLEEDQFDRMYIVTIRGDERGSLVTLRYGHLTP